MAKKSIETGEDCDAIPESMRKYLAMQALESGKPLVRDMMNANGMPSFGGLIMNADSSASKVCMSQIPSVATPLLLLQDPRLTTTFSQ